LKNLLAKIKTHAAQGEAYVILAEDPPGRGLYENNGFKDVTPAYTGTGLLIEMTRQGQAMIPLISWYGRHATVGL
jgi:hypothetical protein